MDRARRHECDLESTTCENTEGAYVCHCRHGFRPIYNHDHRCDGGWNNHYLLHISGFIIAYDAARNIAFPDDYGPLLGHRACVGGTTANASVVGLSAGPWGLPTHTHVVTMLYRSAIL